MNGKKSKQLRRECREIPKMVQTKSEYSKGKVVINSKGGTGNQMHSNATLSMTKALMPVNHYRNAKKLYTGNVSQAVKKAIVKAQNMELFGHYSY